MGRYVANLLVGKLDTQYLKPYLVSSKILEQTNHSTIARFVNDGLGKLPNWVWKSILGSIGIAPDNVVILTTDGASYMIKAAKSLQVFYPNLLHITCICHGLHRVAEEIRAIYPEVDELINQIKKVKYCILLFYLYFLQVFLKAPYRIALYKETCQDIPLPPQPILTRWGTWLDAAIFYAENFEKIKEVCLTIYE